MNTAPEKNKQDIGTRGPEIGVAVFLALIAILVIADSLRIGIGWADDGPRSGYFPFYIGGLLLSASVAVLVSAWRERRAPDPVFVERGQFKSVLAVLLPTILYVGVIGPLGIYVASSLLIGWFMRRHGQFKWALTVAIAIVVPLVFFLVFERWFLVPLPKGPLEHAFGL